jgi:hypothetical protein
VTRTFSIVPTRAGPLRIDSPRIQWWDARSGVARTATLPPIEWQVAPGVGAAATPAPTSSFANVDGDVATDGRIRIPGIQGRILPWAAAAALFAVLWLVTLLWALDRRAHPKHATTPQDIATPSSHTPPDLRRALKDGDLGDIAEALCASVTPPAPDIDTLRDGIDDPAQRDALDQLQRARWADGDPRAAREALRAAFAHGVRVGGRVRPGTVVAGPLPPLYPTG